MYRTICRVSLVAAVLSVIAFAWSVSNVRGQGSWATSPAVKSLYEKAKAEGQVVLWGPNDQELDWIPQAFNKGFPGIEVKWTADLAAMTKVIAEYRAGRHTVDTFIFSLGGIMPLAERGVLGPNDWSVFGVVPEDIFFGGNAAATHNLLYAVVYNTDKVRESDLPKTWDGFLDPKFKDKLSASDFLWPRFLGFLALSWGEEKTIEFARAMRDKQNIAVTGTAVAESMVKTGERPIALANFPQNAIYWKTVEKAPTAWAPVSPTGAVQFVSSALSKAPHPNAAKLLAGWLASDEAKEIREQVREGGANLRSGSRSKITADLRARGVKWVLEDVTTMKQRAEFANRINPVVTGQQR